ncbi:MAG: hypothetical protein ABW118_19180 [Candidatus Thiodiazotropha sp.]
MTRFDQVLFNDLIDLTPIIELGEGVDLRKCGQLAVFLRKLLLRLPQLIQSVEAVEKPLFSQKEW